MSDNPQLVSLHLGDAPRRELYRAARAVVRAGCGDLTLAGDACLVADDPGDGPTAMAVGGPGRTLWLRDGDALHKLSVGVNSVGRLPDNAVVVRDEHVSRRHCAVVVHRDGRAEVHDVASKNGTVVNGRKIHGPTRLGHGDELHLCGRRLVFVAGGGEG